MAHNNKGKRVDACSYEIAGVVVAGWLAVSKIVLFMLRSTLGALI